METNTLKLLGVALHSAMPLEDNKNSKEFRRLIVRLERRQRASHLLRPPEPRSSPARSFAGRITLAVSAICALITCRVPHFLRAGGATLTACTTLASR